MTQPADSCDVIVLGGGAAGLMCALTAGQRGRRVRVLERSNRVGKKILMSGGGRCNFTNLHTSPANYLSANPHFCKSALARYTPQDFLALVEHHGIAYHEKELGQLFCDGSSRQIVQLLEDECRAAGVRIEVNCGPGTVTQDARGFVVQTPLGLVHAPALVVATGGLSIPRMGASGYGYALARQFEHRVLPTRAALVPLTFDAPQLARFGDLSGVALPVRARCTGPAFGGGLLFTHRGLSGPAVLQASSYRAAGSGAGNAVQVDLLPDRDALAWLADCRARSPLAELRTVLSEALPRRLALRLCELELPSRPLRQYAPQELAGVAGRLAAFEFPVAGDEGYRTAEVTLGGVDTAGLSSSTLMSRRVPGLYFIGEVVDVTGHLGGFNFQWAWASGRAAGLSA